MDTRYGESSFQNGWSSEFHWGVLRRDKGSEAAKFGGGQIFQSLKWHTNEFEVFLFFLRAMENYQGFYMTKLHFISSVLER